MTPTRKTPPAHPQELEVVDPRWLLRALLIAVIVALVFGYLTLGFLFRQGAWQLVLHPTRSAGEPPLVHPDAERVRFFPDLSGHPQISGEWIPAVTGGRFPSSVFLVCRSGDGEVGVDDRALAESIHSLGSAALFFDYRGYGQSSPGMQPSQPSMEADAAAAWTYLTATRGVSAGNIVVYGDAIGSVAAAHLVAQTASAAALVLRNADAGAFSRILADPRGRMFPVRLLLRDRYDIRDDLGRVTAPKLLISAGSVASDREAVYRSAPDPKTTLELPHPDAVAEREALSRFLADHVR